MMISGQSQRRTYCKKRPEVQYYTSRTVIFITPSTVLNITTKKVSGTFHEMVTEGIYQDRYQ